MQNTVVDFAGAVEAEELGAAGGVGFEDEIEVRLEAGLVLGFVAGA